MSITMNASAAFFNSNSIVDGVTNTNNNTAVTVESDKLRIWDLVTLTQTGSASLPNNSPQGVSLINSSSAVVVYGSVNTIDLVELSTGYRQAYSGGTAALSLIKGQVVAGDPSTGIAFSGSSAINAVNRINGNTFTVTSITNFSERADFVQTVILKSPGRWIAGGRDGQIWEIDSRGEVLDFFTMTLDMFPVSYPNVISGSFGLSIAQLSYADDHLVVEVAGSIAVINWLTKVVTKTVPTQTISSSPGYFLSPSASGVFIAAPIEFGSQGFVLEVDATIEPLTVRDKLHLDTNNPLQACGFNPVTNYAWTAYRSNPNKIYSFVVTPRASTLRTVTVQSASSGGSDQSCRVLVLDDTSGVGTAKLVVDDYITSPASVRVPAGKTIMEVIKIGSGSDATFDISRYST